MARYFFDVHDGQHFTADKEGLEFESIEAAREEAIAALPELARDVLRHGGRENQMTFEVTAKDQAGHQVLRATLSLNVQRLG